MIAGLANGLGAMDEDAIHRHVARRFKDARMAGNVVFYVGGAHLSFTALEMIFAEARKLKTRKES
jgi:threonine/homoserine/homoserine lactone efflux protein